MKIVELIREKAQKIHQVNFSSDAFETQMRDFGSSLSEHFSRAKASDVWNRISQSLSLVEQPNVEMEPQVQAYYDHLWTLLGTEIYEGAWVDVSQETVNVFSKITQDEQWIHIDVERARLESPFRSTVVPGFLILSMIPKMRNYSDLVGMREHKPRLVVNCGLDQVRFLNPVKTGKRLRVRSTLKHLTPSRKCVDVTEQITVDIEPGAKRACMAEILYRVYL